MSEFVRVHRGTRAFDRYLGDILTCQVCDGESQHTRGGSTTLCDGTLDEVECQCGAWLRAEDVASIMREETKGYAHIECAQCAKEPMMNPNDLIVQAVNAANAAYPVRPGDPSLREMHAKAKRLSDMIGTASQTFDEAFAPQSGHLAKLLSDCEELAYALRSDLERMTR